MFLQEHWLRESQFHRIKNIPYNDCMILSHDVSAMNDTVFTQGRGFGGCSIIWKTSLKAKVTPILMSNSRLCALQICIESKCFLIFNVYMPCDVANNIDEYTSVWEQIIDTCEKLHCDNVIIGGDFNTSVERPHSSFTKYLSNVVIRKNLHICVNNNELLIQKMSIP